MSSNSRTSPGSEGSRNPSDDHHESLGHDWNANDPLNNLFFNDLDRHLDAGLEFQSKRHSGEFNPGDPLQAQYLSSHYSGSGNLPYQMHQLHYFPNPFQPMIYKPSLIKHENYNVNQSGYLQRGEVSRSSRYNDSNERSTPAKRYQAPKIRRNFKKQRGNEEDSDEDYQDLRDDERVRNDHYIKDDLHEINQNMKVSNRYNHANQYNFQYNNYPSMGNHYGHDFRDPQPTDSKRSRLPPNAVCVLKEWFYRHSNNPYPTEDEKEAFTKELSLTILQVNNWFTNARRRLLPDRG